MDDPTGRRQLFHLLHHVDVTYTARYDPVSKTYTPRQDVAPVAFAVVWPNGVPCTLVEVYLVYRWRRGEATVREDGGSLRADVAKLSHLIRYCGRMKKDFWELDNFDLKDLVVALQAERRATAPLEPARNNNTIRDIIAAIVRFLLWLRDEVLVDEGFIGIGRNYRIQLANRKVRDHRGKVREVPMFYYLPPRATRRPKPPMSREDRDRLWQAVSDVSSINSGPPIWARRFPKEGALADILLYLKKRRELVLELLEATGHRPGELASLRVPDNEDCYKTRVIVLDVFKRRMNVTHRIPLQAGVAMNLQVFICKHRARLLSHLTARGVAASPNNKVILEIFNGRPLAARSIESEFSRLVEHAGIGDRQSCMSMFRHRFITKQVAIHLQAFLGDNNKRRSIMTDADYRTILKRVATITGHGSEESLWHYIDLAWTELGMFDRIEAATACDSIIESNLTSTIALIGDVEQGRRKPGIQLVETVKDRLQKMHIELRGALDRAVRSHGRGV